jgi:hypothetical protein
VHEHCIGFCVSCLVRCQASGIAVTILTFRCIIGDTETVLHRTYCTFKQLTVHALQLSTDMKSYKLRVFLSSSMCGLVSYLFKYSNTDKSYGTVTKMMLDLGIMWLLRVQVCGFVRT